ncbi:electron transport complex subunit RsxC [Photobacterium angustum]|uniref:Ion-translocating oxidoreductase complex subunit C n=1 Tax=Photobacterium angustum TaxID=661 RepID=A0A855SFI9_PHOAN|nr:electron transport complex subunit RsxC [Photobacterium angustum]PSW89578.1 electron transport complex subunit RsxC [Photobacterium angustum]PSX07144.1 electron transport complex subunit RsxC [Photobacterium angustum]PSX14930.1 electron transport complex subunit RsxC [Photobacterium angustum]PSX23462.1 electron transport complex subunit RsxC [Photobacterium angustum]PSX42060.1 electron transport complex subunit RsxC [Photobacterium angustum]
MLSIIEQIKQGKLWDFHGGIHPAENKKISNQAPIVSAGIPQELVLPLKQHIGSKGDIIVAVGDKVQKGQALTQGDIAMCVPVHAPTSGTVIAIEQRTTAHPSGLSDLCIVLHPDHTDTWGEKKTYADYQDRDPAELIETIRLSGIAGLGGAGFPTARKLQGGLGNVDILIINAAECEPYITADDRLMRDYAEEVIEGVRILRHIISPKLTIIGIEDNKPEAIKALEQHVTEADNILIRVVPTKYPSGSSKQLVKILTGREVPSQSRSTSVGVIMQNIGTAFAIKRAIIDGEPLIERVVTLTGEAFKKRGNVFAMLGTPIAYLLDKFGYKADKKHPRVIIGGSLMGFTLPHSNVPITKITNCILAPKRKELPLHTYEMACIRCSACADVCPSSLLPQQLQWYAKDQNYDKCEEYNLQDCIECGACAYVCPSEIPLVQYYRQAKAEIWARSQDEMNAERARQRFEAKQARMERDKAERENRFKKAADSRRDEMAKTGGDDAVAAAIARVKAKQAAAAKADTAEVKPAVAAAIAKAKAKQAASAQNVTSESLPDNSEMAKLREERKRQARERKAEKEATANNQPAAENDSKKDAVAAAVARAKARKAAQQTETQAESTPESVVEAENVDPKKAAVAAAVARAKARKAAQQAEAQAESAPEPVVEAENVDPKKAAIAAAVARAKARKVTQQAEAQAESTPESVVEAENVDPKKAAVAAAVARAKARKAAQQAEAQAESASEPVVEAENVDPKKAAVAAAVARAKTRKAAQQAEAQAESAPEPVVEAENVDPKKAAVAAAVARAKARKAAQQAAKEQQNIEED